tara:strand:- start:1371 stop:1637 length:267 start_codon:yes stop_codon:yes gene_type:complete
MKTIKLNKVGKRLTTSYNEWKQYVSDSVQYTTLKKEVPKSINKLKTTLSKLDDKFLGKCSAYLDIKYIRKKAQEMQERTKRFINVKGY